MIALVAMVILIWGSGVSGGSGGFGDDHMVHCIRDNVFRYTAAREVCKQLGGRLATRKEVHSACKNGANWDTLGWCDDFYAYDCRNGHMRGGKLPGQLKLGVYCFSAKPNPLMEKRYNMVPYM